MPTFDVGVRNSVRIQLICNEELVVASDATACRWCAACTGQLGVAFRFNFAGQRTCYVTSEIHCNKLMPVVAKVTWGRNRAHHYASSLLRIKSLFLIPSSYTSVSRLFFHFDHLTDGRAPWTSDQLVARPLPKHRTTQTQNKHRHIPNMHALCGILTHDHGFRAREDSTCLRPLGYRDRLTNC
jgi:hypothetical protein